jgi:hypothetical protein
MSGRKHSEERWHEGDIEDRHNAYVEGAAHLAWLNAYFLKKILDLVEERTRMLLKDVTGRGEQNALAAALEKIDPQGHLEVAQLLRNIRLGDAKPIGRTAETASFSNGQKIP